MVKIRNGTAFTAISAALLLVLGKALAQDSAPIISHTFEQNDGGWHAMGGSGIASITHDTASVKSGKGALQYAYSLKKGDFDLLLLPTPDMALVKAKSFKFWIKTDHATALAIVLQEKDGGRYTAIFSTPKNSWQEVQLSVGDFYLDQGKDAPKDADGKLDMDKVDTLAVADVAQFFVQLGDAAGNIFGVTEGPRTLFLDDFTANATAIAPSASLKGGEGSLDDFSHPQLGWINTGIVELAHVSGKPLEGAGMQAKYHQAPGKFAGIMRNISQGSLAGANSLALSIASAKPAKLIVQVEEKGGGKYNTMIELPGNSGRADLSVKFADFKAADDSKDDNNKLDLDQITQIIFYDVTGALDQTEADNTLWINNVKAVK